MGEPLIKAQEESGQKMFHEHQWSFNYMFNHGKVWITGTDIQYVTLDYNTPKINFVQLFLIWHQLFLGVHDLISYMNTLQE